MKREEVAPELLALLSGQELYKADLTKGYGSLAAEEVHSLDDADVAISRRVHQPENGYYPQHYVMLDLDVEAHLVPSSTPGHSHLYIKTPITTEQMQELLFLCARLGIVETGYASASIDRGFTTLRLPWVSKKDRPGTAPDWLPQEEAPVPPLRYVEPGDLG